MLSQTSEYAMRAMSCLACRPNSLVSTVELAEITKVPSNYLAKVLQSLAQADLISGRRGVGGGYQLKRPPSEITLFDVITAITNVDRITSAAHEFEHKAGPLKPLYHHLETAAKKVVDHFQRVTLQDIVLESGPIERGMSPELATNGSVGVAAVVHR
ncbi:MAG: Rrf2 family transcriptional regulator [Planctomycetota bacterium]